MNKILLEVSVPLIEKKFDIFIPINKKVGRVIVLVSQAINELTDGSYIVKENTVLCSKETGKPYDPNVVVKNSGLINGAKVLLI